MTQTSSLNPYHADVIECPYPMHERMREQGVYHLASADTYVVSRLGRPAVRPQALRAVL